jgi:ABC-type dipeptide/oligopeptide/nickel transport system ATPase component
MGPSGCGKTTTALSLLRGGFELFGDEHSVLNASEDGIRVTGFMSAPRVVGKTPRTLAELELTLQSTGESKNAIALSKAKVLRQNPWLRPALMLFLRIGSGITEHLISPLSIEEAFVRVTEQVLDPTNVFRKAEQTQAIIRSIEQCRAYELVLGKNLASLPELVRSLMESAP